MKAFRLFFISALLMLLFSFQPPDKNVITVRKVVIDAGHGGHDPGAVGKKSKEKDITLSIALKLGKLINQHYPNVEVIYTRKTDVFVELHKRARIANESKADLFISIHCNSTTKTEPKGTETWVMGLHKSEANLEVAKKENGSILFESDYASQYDGFDPNSPEANIIFSLYQNVFLEQSLDFAARVQKQFTEKEGRVNRGVKQAGFLVLYKTTMPGVLIEAGFISNAEEEEYMSSEKGQNSLAMAIFRAFRDYKSAVDGDAGKVVVEKPAPAAVKDTVSTANRTDTVNYQAPAAAAVIVFRVQFAISSSRKALDAAEFSGLQDVRVYFHNGIYKYTVGNEKSLEEAVALQKDMQKKGYKDAFVVAFRDEERISPDEAVRLLKK
jgi:N-acetylmuramoyl-L-alanine amidase